MNSNKDNEKTRIVNDGNTSSSGNEDKRNISNDSKKGESKDNKSGVSKGTFAAGVGAAGVGGVAAGAAFSDEIKGAFTNDEVNADQETELEENIEIAEVEALDIDNEEELVEAEEVNPEEINSLEGETVSEIEPLDAEIEMSNEMHLEVSDSEGFYEVTVNDYDGDGHIDSMSVDAELVDGSHISFSASGTALDELMEGDGLEFADPTDYIQEASSGYFDGFGGESIGANEYEIQSGDTLSEIAEAHGTSVAHIMDLNPQIDNPNVIYAGDDILIPENDTVSGPYEGWRPEWSDTSNDFAEMETESYAYEGEEQAFDVDNYESASLDYDSVDWESFEDQPMEDYSAYFDQEDFSSYDSPDAYYDSGDFGGFDFC